MLDEFQIFRRKLDSLKEREKELNCLYRIEEILKSTEADLDDLFRAILKAMPAGWQYPSICEARITFEGNDYQSDDFRETGWMQIADIIIDQNIAGKIEVCYTQMIRLVNNSQFLPQEENLLNTIARRVSDFIFHRRLKRTLTYLNSNLHQEEVVEEEKNILSNTSDEHWRWRIKMAGLVASKMNMEKLGAKAVYLIGSTKTGTAGPASDIDFLVHVTGDDEKMKLLQAWMDGWGLCLAEVNYLKTGYRTENLIDLHLVTDVDLYNKTSYALYIDSSGDQAKLLRKA
jgi:hypothetical protein